MNLEGRDGEELESRGGGHDVNSGHMCGILKKIFKKHELFKVKISQSQNQNHTSKPPFIDEAEKVLTPRRSATLHQTQGEVLPMTVEKSSAL